MKELPLFKVYMRDGVDTEVSKTLYSGFIGQGKKVEEFEGLLSSFLKTDYVLTVNSATSALHLFFHMFKEKGAEVLASPLTCTASNFPVLANGMDIKWVDVDSTCNMDLDDLERKLSPKTKIILLVHWGGNPIDLQRVDIVLDKCQQMYGFRPVVIQDNAHSLMSEYNGKMLSEYYNSAYSFQAIKHLTTGDGGCLILNDREDYQRAKLLRWYGLDREGSKDFRCEQDVLEWGYKFHMNDINATIGIHNLKGVGKIVERHRGNSAYLNSQLKDVSGIDCIGEIENGKSSNWIHTILVEDRDSFVRKMADHGIHTSQVHKRNDFHSCLSKYRVYLPSLDRVGDRMVCIPNGWWLSQEDLEYIVSTIKTGW